MKSIAIDKGAVFEKATWYLIGWLPCRVLFNWPINQLQISIDFVALLKQRKLAWLCNLALHGDGSSWNFGPMFFVCYALQVFQCTPDTQGMQTVETLTALRATIQCEQPTTDLYMWECCSAFILIILFVILFFPRVHCSRFWCDR